ncbi:putative cytochrome P450 hydroxylase [[Actinomadura] parvosata subsp. kistnae]|uniref:Cytochrome P450 hydroxylase n=3 Tax=[Actinomadura] parvosata subsp. kistnae TaxID=1909395 RepID=A0ABF7PM91_9ACTN|nr:cytochrome P450 [Nonomuraea sp. ATCC 55076]7TTB_A Chain A, Putative cytochrome P450 hydroxylase [Actinomadura parvosata subsp. kistnae]7TTO_A Chain A, cytochrome P450 hydroxylase [Actinomadura parvosata subsp. kistnae]7TTP_A Chain A, cytochrome P450 hydroxylase [Actinomadura parvosata subsp. kistnae]7TTQ_A Chain A, cytochrome P450 hydroxylase [Actinomadura parvosata subsp. kistnae]SPL92151.1 putative cytochrome P450 hydroxylase [Actinomadura parvosata subsp. kistnae]
MVAPEHRVLHLRDRLDLAAELKLLCERGPLVRIPLEDGSAVHWFALGYDVVREVLGSEKFDKRVIGTHFNHQEMALPGNLLQLDPPEHTRLRRMVAPAYSVRRMQALEPRVQAIVDDHLDTMASTGPPVEFLREVAGPMAARVACEFLGIPLDDRGELIRLTAHRGGKRRRVLNGHAYLAYMRELAARLRRDPGDGMLGMVARDHGADISDEELAGLCAVVMNSSVEQTESCLAAGTLLLLEHPEQFALLRERPELGEQAVEEIVRYLSVFEGLDPRTATEDVEIGGQVIKKGEAVFCSLLAANRADPALDGFDITRKESRHVAFGHGIHHCLGAPLARMELRIAFTTLVSRFPSLRTAVPAEEIRFRPPSSNVFTLLELPLTW